MCLLHDSEEYGVLRWSLKEIAQALGAPMSLLKELVIKEVLKGSDAQLTDPLVYTPVSGRKKGDPVVLVNVQSGPIWYSSRMVTDEHIRQKKANHELFKDSPHYSPMPPLSEGSDASNKSPMPTKSDLPTSPSTSSLKTTPIPPEGGKESKKKNAVALQTYLEECKASGVKPIPDDDTVFDYSQDVGLHSDLLWLQWREFVDRYKLPGAKRYKDWRSVFRKSVRGNWFRLWYVDSSGQYVLTTQGLQAQKLHKGGKAA